MTTHILFLFLGIVVGAYVYRLVNRKSFAVLVAEKTELLEAQKSFRRKVELREYELDRAASISRSIADHYDRVRCKNRSVDDLRRMLDQKQELPHWLSIQLNLCFQENDDLPYPKDDTDTAVV